MSAGILFRSCLLGIDLEKDQREGCPGTQPVSSITSPSTSLGHLLVIGGVNLFLGSSPTISIPSASSVQH